MYHINFPKDVLNLSEFQIVAQGGERLVYQSELYPELLFKLQKRAFERGLKPWDLKSFLLRTNPNFRNYIVVRENKEFVNLCLNGAIPTNKLPIARLYGFAESDKGTVQIVEKISIDGHRIGPTLDAIFSKCDFGAHDLAMLNRFALDLLNSRLATNDVSPSNIVLGRGSDGEQRFVLVDGIGDIQVIPILTFFQAARKAHLVRRFTKIGGMRLDFDPATFEFSLAAGAKATSPD